MGYFTQIETKNPTSIISLALILYQMRRSELLLTVNKIEDGSTPSMPRRADLFTYSEFFSDAIW